MRTKPPGSYNQLYHNDCHGHFTNVSEQAGMLKDAGFGDVAVELGLLAVILVLLACVALSRLFAQGNCRSPCFNACCSPRKSFA